MIRTLTIAAFAAVLAGCTPPAPAAKSVETPPAPAAPDMPPPPPWVSAGDADSTRISIDQDGFKLSFTCLAAPKKKIRVDLFSPGLSAKAPDGAKMVVSFSGGGYQAPATFEAPTTASGETGYLWTATFPANADIVTGFTMGEEVRAEVTWKGGDETQGSGAVGFEMTGEVNQFGTDCAQITGLK
jgi:hypothetical protein